MAQTQTRDFDEDMNRLLDSVECDGLDLRGGATVNPTWLAAELGEIGSGDLRKLLLTPGNAITDASTLVTISHGDFHADNILCSHLGGRIPHPVIIDFEATHDLEHICRDFARLEADLLCGVFDWEPAAVGSLLRWYGTSLSTGLSRTDSLGGASDRLRVAYAGIATIRKILASFKQPNWQLTTIEYEVALLGSLLPMVRYLRLTKTQRQVALIAASLAASDICDRLGRARPGLH